LQADSLHRVAFVAFDPRKIVPPERFQKRRNDIIDHSNPVSMTSSPFHRCDVVTSASEEDSDEAENRLEAVPETAPEFPNTEIRCSIREIGARTDRGRSRCETGGA